MREIKFRLLHKPSNSMMNVHTLHWGSEVIGGYCHDCENNEILFGIEEVELMQYTGLKDKNGLTEIYEGDIIDENGLVKGNVYESPQVFREGIDCVVKGMGTAEWRGAESIAMGRGCNYTK